MKKWFKKPNFMLVLSEYELKIENAWKLALFCNLVYILMFDIYVVVLVFNKIKITKKLE